MTSDWLRRLPKRHAATDAELDAVQIELGVAFPGDYRAVMREADGGDTAFGQSWVVLWPVAELVERNAGYQTREFAPGFTFFGSDGGGEAYAWDWRSERRSSYVVVPFITPDPKGAVPCGDTFEDFLRCLFRGISASSPE